ncbi:MAG: 50S ribosomal protein L15 [Patescibacteria group bacterium]|nr:50S ribosomal protein L15 [Patescibacteria group bacterium]
MELNLHTLKTFQKKKKRKRVGRGDASGHGSYSGRGQKGQKARSGGKRGIKIKALRKIWKKIPKHGGFKSKKKKPTIINLEEIEKNFLENEEVNPDSLFEKGLIKNQKEKIKILGQGKISKKLIFKAHAFSKSAEAAIKKAGGAIIKIQNSKFKIQN